MTSKLSRSYPNCLEKKSLAKERNEMVKKRRRNVDQEINSMGARVLADVGCASFD
jgi:hypothetical protein